MPPPATDERYKHYRFPGESISHGVWLYRDVQELLLARGMDVTHEAIRQASGRHTSRFAQPSH
jgi:transposase-like protein